MPCYDPRRDYDDNGEGWSVKAERLQKRCDILSRLLCEACNLLESAEDTTSKAIDYVSDELRSWWKEHQEFDRKRKQKGKRK